jgi:hypothetical protein
VCVYVRVSAEYLVFLASSTLLDCNCNCELCYPSFSLALRSVFLSMQCMCSLLASFVYALHFDVSFLSPGGMYVEVGTE